MVNNHWLCYIILLHDIIIFISKNWHGENTDTKYSSNAMILLQILPKCQFYIHIGNIGSKIDWTIIQKHVHQWTSIGFTGHIYNFNLSICVIHDNLSLWKIIMWNESTTTSTRAKPYWYNKLVKYLSFLVFGDTEIMFSNKNEIRFESLEILKFCSITERKSFWILGEDRLWSLLGPRGPLRTPLFARSPVRAKNLDHIRVQGYQIWPGQTRTDQDIQDRPGQTREDFDLADLIL